MNTYIYIYRDIYMSQKVSRRVYIFDAYNIPKTSFQSLHLIV